MGSYDLSGSIVLRDAFSGTFDKLEGGVGRASRSFSGLAAAAGIGLGAVVASRAIGEMVALATEMEEVRGVFDNLTKSAGVNSDQMLAKLRTASRGMSSDLDLLKSANRAYLADNQEVFRNLDVLYKAAAIGADALGLSTTQAFDEMTQAISAQQSRALKRFGINVDASAANEAYAKSMGLVASKLTATQKEAAFALDAIGQLKDLIERSGDTALSTADKIDIYRASITNLKTEWGKLIAEAPTVQKALGWGTSVLIETKVMDQYGQLHGLLGAMGLAFGKTNSAMDDLRQQFRDGTLSAAEYEDALRRLLGLIGTMAPGYGVPKLTPPAARFGSQFYSPNQYRPDGSALGAASGLFGLTSEQNIGILADATDAAAEATRRLAENQGTYNDRLAESNRLMENLRSDAEKVLMAGTSVTQGDVLATQAGTYKDKPLEAARRLEDIANRGMDSPWAKILVPPAEVIAQGDAAIKAWAAGTKQDVLDLTRPDLINWDAFVAGFDQMKQREAGKALTLDIAIGKLDEAGLLTGVSQEDRKKQVAKALGIDTGMFGGLNLGADLVGQMDSDFKANEAGFKNVGKRVGAVTSTAFLEAMKGNVGNLLDVFVGMLTPPVAAAVLAVLEGSGSKP